MARAELLSLLHQPMDHPVGVLKVLCYCAGSVWEPSSFLVPAACELCRLWLLAWPQQPEQDGSAFEALQKGQAAAVCVCLPSRPSPRPATRLRLLPFMVLSSSTNFKRPTVLISEGALPPSQEGRAITELANYTLELGVCFIQAMALWTFWSGPGKKRPLLTKLYRLKAYRMSWESAVYHLTLVFLIQGIKQS